MDPCNNIPDHKLHLYQYETDEELISAKADSRWHIFIFTGKNETRPNLITSLKRGKHLNKKAFEDLLIRIYWNFKQFYVNILKRPNTLMWNTITGYILINYIAQKKLSYYCKQLCKYKKAKHPRHLKQIRKNAKKERKRMYRLYKKRTQQIEEQVALPHIKSHFITSDYLTKTDYDICITKMKNKLSNK